MTQGEIEQVCPFEVETVPLPRKVSVSVRVEVVESVVGDERFVVLKVLVVLTVFRVAVRKRPVPWVRLFGVRMALAFAS